MPAVTAKRRKLSPVKRRSPRKAATPKPIETKEKKSETPENATPATAITLNPDVSPEQTKTSNLSKKLVEVTPEKKQNDQQTETPEHPKEEVPATTQPIQTQLVDDAFNEAVSTVVDKGCDAMCLFGSLIMWLIRMAAKIIGSVFKYFGSQAFGTALMLIVAYFIIWMTAGAIKEKTDAYVAQGWSLFLSTLPESERVKEVAYEYSAGIVTGKLHALSCIAKSQGYSKTRKGCVQYFTEEQFNQPYKELSSAWADHARCVKYEQECSTQMTELKAAFEVFSIRTKWPDATKWLQSDAHKLLITSLSSQIHHYTPSEIARLNVLGELDPNLIDLKCNHAEEKEQSDNIWLLNEMQTALKNGFFYLKDGCDLTTLSQTSLELLNKPPTKSTLTLKITDKQIKEMDDISMFYLDPNQVRQLPPAKAKQHKSARAAKVQTGADQ